MFFLVGAIIVFTSSYVSSTRVLENQALAQKILRELNDQLKYTPKRAEFKVGSLAQFDSIHQPSDPKKKNKYKHRRPKSNDEYDMDAIVKQLQIKLNDIIYDSEPEERPTTTPDYIDIKSDLQTLLNLPKKGRRPLNDIKKSLLSILSNFSQQKSSNVVKKPRQPKSQQPSNLLADNKKVNLDKYSRIFIILNPQALDDKYKKHYVKGNVRYTMPRIRKKRYYYHTQGTTSRTPMSNPGAQTQEVVIYADWRRRRGDDDSLESEYKPKRSRSGGESFHTAIPFIGHKGDIYERSENKRK